METHARSRPPGQAPLWIVCTQASLPDATEQALASLKAGRRWVLETPEAWKEFENAAGEEAPGLVVAVGGDGTVRGVVGAIGSNADVRLGLVPAGTGNDFARALEIPIEPGAAVEVVQSGETRLVDLLSVRVDGGEPELAVNAVTLGLSGSIHAELDEDTKERWGRFAYLRCALRGAVDLEPFSASLELSEESGSPLREHWSGRLLHISLANGPRAGGGVPIAPAAVPYDGRLDICGVVEGDGLAIGLGVAEVLAEGDPGDPWLVASGTRVVLRLDEVHRASVDGEVIEAKEIDVELLPGALTVCAPSGEG